MSESRQHDLATRNRPPDSHAFPVRYALDFQHVDLTAEDLDDVQMVWWLFCGYCPQLDVRPMGTRTELTCMVHLIAQRMRVLGEFAPRVQIEWPLYMRTGVAWARDRMQWVVLRGRTSFVPEASAPQEHNNKEEDDVRDRPPTDYEDPFPFASGPLPHVLLLVHLRPLLSQLSETARLMQPLHASAGGVTLLHGGRKTISPKKRRRPAPPPPSEQSVDGDPLPPKPWGRRLLGSCCCFGGRVRPSLRTTPIAGIRAMRRCAISDLLDLSNTLLQVAEERRRGPLLYSPPTPVSTSSSSSAYASGSGETELPCSREAVP